MRIGRVAVAAIRLVLCRAGQFEADFVEIFDEPVGALAEAIGKPDAGEGFAQRSFGAGLFFFPFFPALAPSLLPFLAAAVLFDFPLDAALVAHILHDGLRIGHARSGARSIPFQIFGEFVRCKPVFRGVRV
jgi:hypothetical protein